jgi:hypothetical protein
MVQPKYSPQEALERVKLMMKYDMSKTLNENKQMISEQYTAPTVAGTAVGAGAGAAAVATSTVTSTAGASVIVPVMSALGVGATAAGAIVGGAAGLALLPLVYWIATKDTGKNKVKKMFDMCSSSASKIAKLPRKLTDKDFRDMSDNVEDAINDTTFGIKGGTDEEKLFAQFKRLQDGTASDFCAFVKYYNSNSDSGNLFDDLDGDIDAEDEWKQIYRPIRNCVEDSLLTIKDEVEEDCKSNPNQSKCKAVVDKGKSGGGSVSKYKDCSGTYTYLCKAKPIETVQACLGLVPDGKYGPKTQAKLKSMGYESFKDSDINKICGKSDSTQQPEIGGEDISINTSDTNF